MNEVPPHRKILKKQETCHVTHLHDIAGHVVVRQMEKMMGFRVGWMQRGPDWAYNQAVTESKDNTSKAISQRRQTALRPC